MTPRTAIHKVGDNSVLYVEESSIRTKLCADKLRGYRADRIEVIRDPSMPAELREYLVKSVLEPMKAGMAVSDISEKKTVEQLKAEYEALTAEVKDIKDRLVSLQPAVDEFGRLSDRLQELNGYGRSKVILAKLALKEALFQREIGSTDNPVIAEPDPLSVSGVSECHTSRVVTTVPYIITGCGGGGSGTKLVIDEETGKGYRR